MVVKNKTIKKSPLIEVLDILTSVKEPSSFPWKIKSESIRGITCAGVLEYIPGKLRGKFMDEIYRILIPEGKAAISCAYWNNVRGIQDFRYAFPPISEQSFLYFNKEWRSINNILTDMICDFDFTYGYSVDAETASRNDESRSFYIKHYTNCIDILQVMLVKRKK